MAVKFIILSKRESNFNYSELITMIMNDFVSDFFESNPRIQDVFPTFTSLKLEAVINSRSLYLHVRRVMTALENAVFSLDDAEIFIEYSIQQAVH